MADVRVPEAEGDLARLLVGEDADRVFSALADPMRRRVLVRLAERGDDASAVAADLGISRQAVVKHLQRLAQAGVVTTGRVSRRHVYRVEPERIREISDLLGAVARGWDRRLSDLAARAEAAESRDR